ncbi:hypothetical protein Lser_V15G12980 [Lactuca serriola]
MGCINSKHVARSCKSPIRDHSLLIHDDDDRSSASSSSTHSSDSLTLQKSNNHYNYNHGFEPLEKIKEETEDDKTSVGSVSVRDNIQKNGDESLNTRSCSKFSKKFGLSSIRFGRSAAGEQVAAGWPAWLSAVAGDAIEGWVPLKSENFEKLDKIGQGTYSNVYRARDLQSGKIMALKKVKFDNFQPESVKFMAREIKILRKLDHPNVMKLEGIITSRLSCSIYLVFEYMEHDLAGLLSSPDVKFTASQIKCYMMQLLKGIDHCHSRGIIHRDIKSSNILVNNEGVLKIADFGLANFYDSMSRQPMTSRVVTLWYRPPELLLGSANYGPFIDMWSIGCVFGELFVGRPILKGRTEVEQLHKIFKICGTPPDEYWTKTRHPLAAMFKPQFTYESSLRERCKELPRTVVDLIDQLLCVEPEKRVTANSALQVEYFYTKPYACDPASMPKYPPNKEMDAKSRETTQRRKLAGRVRSSGGSRNHRKVHAGVPEGPYHMRSRESVRPNASYNTLSEASQMTETLQDDSICTHSAQSTSSDGSFMYATKRRNLEKRHSMQRIDSLYSSEVYKPEELLSSERKEQERFRHMGPMLIQSRKQNEYYSRDGVRRSRFSKDSDFY